MTSHSNVREVLFCSLIVFQTACICLDSKIVAPPDAAPALNKKYWILFLAHCYELVKWVRSMLYIILMIFIQYWCQKNNYLLQINKDENGEMASKTKLNRIV